jgi:hypothetical protein
MICSTLSIVIARSVSDEAIQNHHGTLDCFASLAMTLTIHSDINN